MRDIAFRNRTLENSSQCEEFETKEGTMKRSAYVSKQKTSQCEVLVLRWRTRLLGCEKKNVTYMLHFEETKPKRRA